MVKKPKAGSGVLQDGTQPECMRGVPAPTPGERFARVLDSVKANGEPMELILRPTTALALAWLVRAGLQQPNPALGPYGAAFVRAVRVFFQNDPAVRDLLDDPK